MLGTWKLGPSTSEPISLWPHLRASRRESLACACVRCPSHPSFQTGLPHWHTLKIDLMARTALNTFRNRTALLAALSLAAGLALTPESAIADPLGTAITYQSQLKNNGTPFTGQPKYRSFLAGQRRAPRRLGQDQPMHDRGREDRRRQGKVPYARSLRKAGRQRYKSLQWPRENPPSLRILCAFSETPRSVS